MKRKKEKEEKKKIGGNITPNFGNVNEKNTSSLGIPRELDDEENNKELFHPFQTRFNYTCFRCGSDIVYDAFFMDDIGGKYIALNPDDLHPHKCKPKKRFFP